jgi:hypothetical protein
MRLVSFNIGQAARHGEQDGDTVIDLQSIDPTFPADLRVVLETPTRWKPVVDQAGIVQN